jgi:hypothetical protein
MSPAGSEAADPGGGRPEGAVGGMALSTAPSTDVGMLITLRVVIDAVDPGTLAARLRAAGFAGARVDVAGDRVRFAATSGR